MGSMLVIKGRCITLGTVRPKYIKNAARKLVELYSDRFNTDFENNKKVINEVADTYSKKLRNRIAGYVTRYIKNMQQQEEIEANTV